MSSALITGASAGLGTDFARILAGQKYDLILVARNASRLAALATQLSTDHGVRVLILPRDLSIPGSAEALLLDIKSQGLAVDVLVNNAGIGMHGPVANADVRALAGMLQLNVTTLTELTRLFLPDMLARKSGRILNVASTAAFQPGPWMAGYYATKAYVLSFSEALAFELKGTGVTITTLCPGPTSTEFFERAKMSRSRMKDIFFADSRACAQVGVNGMLQGKTMVIHGTLNWMLVLSSKFFPRAIVRFIVGKINR
jgi:uncharacterized protein